jgi:Zn-finger nucleic acid-binding protein
MDCPVCKKTMIILELQQVEIDHCTFCSGIWLDEGELELLLEGAKERDQLLSSLEIDPSCREKKRRCPRCRRKMLKVHAGKNKDVLIDKCPQNHGIWFDEGELQEVIRLGSLDEENRVLKLLNEMFRHKLER